MSARSIYDAGTVVRLDVPAGETRRYSGEPTILQEPDPDTYDTVTFEYPEQGAIENREQDLPSGS
ncbi:MAG: hypothetical protein ABEJ31_02830 [Haloarculaceae archaeon]